MREQQSDREGHGIVHIVIFRLKWSYGSDENLANLARQLEKYAHITLFAGQMPPSCRENKVARSDEYGDEIRDFVNPLVYARILKKVRRCDPQVIYFLGPHVLNAPLALLCRLFTDACVISHVHDARYARSSRIAIFADLVARLQSMFSHRVYCYGTTIKSKIIEYFKIPGERIATFRLGPSHWTQADVDGEPSAGPRDKFSMIGTIIHRKGVEYFLEAAQIFNERHGDHAAQFLLAGAGDLSKYRDGIDQLPNLVVVNRFVEDAEVNEFLASSYASVLPYTEGVMQSSFIAIAYGNGCPVIVSNLGSLPEEVENGRTGFVVERANAEQIAGAMTKIFEGRRGTTLSERCVRAYREKFNWDQIGERVYRDMEASVAQLRAHGCGGRGLRKEENQPSRSA